MRASSVSTAIARKALAFSSDVTPRYCEADPFEGGKQAVAECWRNLTAVGAEPIAATDNLNFGNPERPEIMGQLVEAVRGIGEACGRSISRSSRATSRSTTKPTARAFCPPPTIGGVGLIDDWGRMARIGFVAPDECILLVGAPDWWGTHLGQSIYLRDLFGRTDGPPPPVDLALEKKAGDLVRILIRDGHATAAHDLGDGGLAVGLAEMAIASGIGASVNQLEGGDPIPQFFGEDQGRYLVTIRRDFLDSFYDDNLPLCRHLVPWIGTTGGNSLVLGKAGPSPSPTSRPPYEGWFPSYMAGEIAA